MIRHELKYQVPAHENRRIMLRQFACAPKLLCIVCVAVILAACFFFSGDHQTALCVVSIGVGGYIGIFLIVLRIASQSWRSQPKTVSFDSEQLTIVSTVQATTFPWRALSKFWSDERYFYFRVAVGGLIYVPRSAFTEEQAAFLVEQGKQIGSARKSR